MGINIKYETTQTAHNEDEEKVQLRITNKGKDRQVKNRHECN